MTKRDYSYDYLRAFSALMIVLCHIFQGYGFSMEIGYYLGGTYVDVFLLLSAYLLGLGSRNKIANNPWQFMKKRGARIIPTYYVFLTITFLTIVFILGLDTLQYKQIFGHYLFLNWFWESSRIYIPPLPQIGHLWFMSCIIFGYLSVVIWSILSNKIGFLNSNRGWVTYFIIWAVISTLLTIRIRFAVYPCTVMTGFIILYFRGQEIMGYIRTINTYLLVFLLIFCNVGGIVYYLGGGYSYPPLIFWINLLNAVLWIACAPLIFNQYKISNAVLFVSTISFEIYLIHHPFCLGAYSLKHYMPTWLASVCVFVISILGGWILSLLTSTVAKIKLTDKYMSRKSN